MNIFSLDEGFNIQCPVEGYESFIWTDRYCGAGDFEIVFPASIEIAKYLTLNSYLINDESEHVMIIESLDYSTNIEDGNKLTIKGRSLESILDRRVVLSVTDYKQGESLQDFILRLIEYEISGATPYESYPPILDGPNEDLPKLRKIENFIWEKNDDPTVTEKVIDTVSDDVDSYVLQNLYDVVATLCNVNNLGFKITLTEDNKFKFMIYAGTNRSYMQATLPAVSFSESMENIKNTEYFESLASYKNSVIVGGVGKWPNTEDEEEENKSKDTDNKTEEKKEERDEDKVRFFSAVGYDSGLNRREIFLDASSINRTYISKGKNKEGEKTESATMSEEQYAKLLSLKGRQELAKNDYRKVTTMTGESEPNKNYVYNEHFFMGDVVSYEDSYGHDLNVRVVEYIFSHDTSGLVLYPTFSAMDYSKYSEELPEGYDSKYVKVISGILAFYGGFCRSSDNYYPYGSKKERDAAWKKENKNDKFKSTTINGRRYICYSPPYEWSDERDQEEKEAWNNGGYGILDPYESRTIEVKAGTSVDIYMWAGKAGDSKKDTKDSKIYLVNSNDSVIKEASGNKGSKIYLNFVPERDCALFLYEDSFKSNIYTWGIKVEYI